MAGIGGFFSHFAGCTALIYAHADPVAEAMLSGRYAADWYGGTKWELQNAPGICGTKCQQIVFSDSALEYVSQSSEQWCLSADICANAPVEGQFIATAWSKHETVRQGKKPMSDPAAKMKKDADKTDQSCHPVRSPSE